VTLPGEEEAEHRHLAQKWIYEDLTDEELALLPAELKVQVQSYFQGLIDEGLRSAEEGGWLDGPESVETVLRKTAARLRLSQAVASSGSPVHLKCLAMDERC
jgi:hypothetical protein